MTHRIITTLIVCLAVGGSCKGEPDTIADPSSTSGASASRSGPAWRPGYVRPPVIDSHTHIMRDGFDRMDRAMDENGLARAANLSGPTLGRGAKDQPAVRAKHPRVTDFFNLEWRMRGRPDFGELMARGLEIAVKEYGYKGLKIPKILGLYADDAEGNRVPVDWPELDPVWAKAGELGVPVAIHTGDPKAFWEPVTPDNERYEELSVHPAWSFAKGYPPREQLLAERDRMIAKHPKTTFICVHFGNNPEDLDYVDALMKRHPNVVIDTAARLGEIGRHPPEKVRDFFIRYHDRILFGTDLGIGAEGLMLGSTGTDEPTWDDLKPFYDAHWRFFEGKERGIAHPTPIQGRWTIDAINLPDEVLKDLYYRNAVRILGVPDPTKPVEPGPGAVAP